MSEPIGRSAPRLNWKRGIAAGAAGLGALAGMLLLCAAFGADWILTRGGERVVSHAALLLSAVLTGALSTERGGGAGPETLVGGGMLLLTALFLGIFTNPAGPFNMSMLLSLLCVIFGVFAGCALRSRRPARRKRKRR